MSKKTDGIISKFEAELKAGKNPGVPDFVRRHQVRSEDLIGALYMLQALYQDKELTKLPAGFKEEQNKLAQCLIDGKPTDWYFRRHRTPEMRVLDVPHPLTKEFGQVPVVTLAAAGKGQAYEPDATIEDGCWERITRPYDLPDKDVFAVEVRGDSLEPMIPNGSVAVINPKKEARSNSLALVITKDYQAGAYFVQPGLSGTGTG
jgi:hypothetical protein